MLYSPCGTHIPRAERQTSALQLLTNALSGGFGGVCRERQHAATDADCKLGTREPPRRPADASNAHQDVSPHWRSHQLRGYWQVKRPLGA